MDDLEANTVEKVLIVLDVGIFLGHLSASGEEEAVGHFPKNKVENHPAILLVTCDLKQGHHPLIRT